MMKRYKKTAYGYRYINKDMETRRYYGTMPKGFDPKQERKRFCRADSVLKTQVTETSVTDGEDGEKRKNESSYLGRWVWNQDFGGVAI